jgi:hypothetical protein
MAFDDGTPLDAAALQALDTKINEVRSSVPKISSSQINLLNQLGEARATEIRGGLSDFFPLTPGKAVPCTISWGEQPLSGKPVSVILTPAKSNGEDPTASMSYTVDTTTVGADKCTVRVYLAAGAKPMTVKFYWLAIVS